MSISKTVTVEKKYSFFNYNKELR